MSGRFLQWCGLAACVCLSALWARPAQGQTTAAGVFVDAAGVLQRRSVPDPTGALTRQRLEAAKAALDGDLAAKSPLRKISLQRLEKALAQRLSENQGPTPEMRFLAGLTRLEYVFFYPETGDIVIAGPAEGFMEDLAGRAVGIHTGRPVLELQDLIVALRACGPDREPPVVGCSIDPTQEGLSRMQQFLREFGSRATPADTRFIVNSLRNTMGMQTVSVHGVPASTHLALVLVEADYRMKLIGIGLEKPPVKLASYVDRVRPSQVARNALVRWWFTPDYRCVRTTDDGLAAQLVGDGVKLVGEDELVTDGGQRRGSGTSNAASEAFTTNFTQKYPELAAKSPVFAQLRHVIDLLVAAAFIREKNLFAKAGWNMPVFGSEERFLVETYNAPKQVETVVTSIWKGNRLMTPLGGGVQIDPLRALESPNLLPDEQGQVRQVRSEIKLELADGQWWWD